MTFLGRKIPVGGVLVFGFLLLVSALCHGEPVKEWTWLVFINADNNLDENGLKDQEEMAAIGSNEWLNLVTLIDREKGPATMNLIEKGRITALQELGEIDMGDPKELIRFVRDASRRFPAKRYILTIWNHGSGWKLARRKAIRGISYDDTSGNHISTNQLGEALKEIAAILGTKLEILNFDACLMQTAEVVFACHEYCRFIVASQLVEPGDGGPYTDVLANLRPDTDSPDFCRHWVRAFVASYDNGSQGKRDATQSAIACEDFPRLIDAINGLAKTLMSGPFRRSVVNALMKVQSFSDPTAVDLLHFARLFNTQVKDTAVQNAVAKLEEAFAAAIIANAGCGSSVDAAFGLSIHFPFDFLVEKDYRDLAFPQKTKWMSMLDFFYGGIRSDQILRGIQRGNLQPLQRFLAREAGKNPVELNRAIHDRITFDLHTENTCRYDLKDEVESLLRRLRE
jgi:hypothetical protein